MGKDKPKPFSDVLKALRSSKQLSRRKLADQIGVSPSAIEKWEQGDALPDQARVHELVRALKLSEEKELLLREAYFGFRLLPSLHNLPAARNPYFTGREDVLKQLYERLAPGSQVALTQAISGLGGIGKTQVALYYVYRFHKIYSHVLWVTADSSASLIAEFLRLAHDLELPEKEKEDQNKAVQAVKRWLREYVKWLLIFDNVEDLSLVYSFIPTGHLGSVLLTTRRQVTEPVAQAIVLDVLSNDEGTLLLLKRAKRLALDGPLDAGTSEEVLTARVITQQLGGLPLALDQAGAYIAETGSSFTKYLELFKQERAALLQRRGTVPSDHPEPVTTTFLLAFEQVRQKSRAASDLLTFCAFLAPDAIPLEIITEGAAHLNSILATVAADTLQLDQALETLQTYSLIRSDGENRTLSIHRLVQAVLQDALEEAERGSWADRVMLAVNATFPHPEYSNWLQCERLLSHALLIARYIEQYKVISEAAWHLLSETASYLRDRARYTEAEPLYQLAIRIQEQQLGAEHPDLATSLNNLAVLYKEQGKYAEAEPLYQRAIAIREQALGPKYFLVAAPLSNLAEIYREQGKYAEAEPLYQRAIAIREQALGIEYPNLAYPINNLAILYYQQGKYAAAEALYQRAIHIWERAHDPENMNVAIALNNLAELYREQGRYVEAESLYQRAISIRIQTLGTNHPHTAYPLNGLAELYRKQKKYVEAESLYQQALDIWEQALGFEHFLVAQPLNGLANLSLEQGRHEKAESLFQQALDIQTHSLGHQHPETAETMYGLAQLHEALGNNETARTWYASALAVRKQILGMHHPKTTETFARLIDLLHAMGQPEEAIQLEAATLEQGTSEEKSFAPPEG
ncbi:MAG TPA: FxSxx-COOH system tetratricopeptide repeat protein [Ktedonosporobacter sp.]|nr:FxSxx-COOH system tetratricopeptide repeat protein [Ktedonosporobacter sp.]